MAESRTLRILLADDHPISLSGMEFLLSGEAHFEVVGSTRSGDEVMALVATLAPDIVILDLMLPGTSGILLLERLTRSARRPCVLVVSGQASGQLFKRAYDLGADAIVSKEDDSEELLAALHGLREGQRYLSATVSRLVGNLADHSGPEVLTAREREILALVAEGCSNMLIATRLSISPRTVKKHRENIRAKLNISTAVEAAQAAARLGLAKLS